MALPGLMFLAGLAVVLAITVFRSDDRSAGGGDPPRVAHVHAVEVNPSDGAVFVATHHGILRLAEGGAAERVGESLQDTMGFTVVGPDRFLGSGHPDVAGLRAGQPGLLGLIESSDAGRTWEARSLAGEVDFHALAHAHGQVYGWDSTSGRFLVSGDGTRWDHRSRLPLLDFAVDPLDPDRIVAATPAGLRRSDDGGRSWTTPAGPELAVIAWRADTSLWGIDPQGGVHRSTDGGDRWEVVSRLPGEPQALSAAGNVLWAAVGDRDGSAAIYFSSDDARSWNVRYQEQRS